MSNSISERIRRLLGSEGTAGRAELPLRILIVGSFILPLSVFLVVCWISYGRHFDDARDLLQRTLGSVHEHAIKVFDTFEVSARYLDEITSNASDQAIVREEADYSLRLRNFISNLPQLRDLWVIDANGHPLVSGTVYPMPRNLDLSDRDYFKAQKDIAGDMTYVSSVVDARAANTNFFAITRKRMANDGKFAGVNLVSIAPEYFVKYYSTLPAAEQSITALVRGDGSILARYQPKLPAAVTRLPPNATIMNAIHANPERGVAIGPTTSDRRERMFAYRKLPNHDVYVILAIETNEIRRQWATTMGSHLIFGLPATVTMIALGFIALRRTRREVAAHAQLRDEVMKRQSTELALRQAQKMEAVGRLTGGIAHDFNNLLTAIIGNTDLAMRRLKTDDERITRSLGSVRQASQRAAILVQRLLTFSRQHPQEVKAVDVNRLVQGMSELLHRTIGEVVTIETVLGTGLWKTALDPNQLENAILNLAVNARDAMEKGGRLTIETTNSYIDEAYAARAGGEIAAGQYVMLAVSDTGSGMAADIRDKVFEPFFTTKRAGLGSGLGLSMVYGFVKQSNGHIQIYSEVGQGTAVKLYFPRLPAESSLPEWSGDEQNDNAPQRSGEHERILLVEDDAEVLNFVRDALRDLGYHVKACTDANSALQYIQSDEKISLLFTDVVLPGGMNGRELAEKAVQLRPGLRVLYATGYTRNAIIHHGRLDPGVELLNKPFTIDALSRKVRDVLDGAAK